MNERRFLVPCAVLALTLVAGTARGDIITASASDNATVQPGGPRPGVNGKIFFNMEGSANGQFASFGVIDFQFPTLLVNSLNSITLQLTQANAAFTHNGGLSFFLAENTTADIQPGSSLAFDSTKLPTGIGTQLGTLHPLGTGTFTQVADGTADKFIFTFASLDAATRNLILTDLANGLDLRVVVGPTDPNVAATYAGFSNNEFAGPQLQLDGTILVVPEPTSFTLFAVGILGLAWRRRQAA
jgi:hypothetical protein